MSLSGSLESLYATYKDIMPLHDAWWQLEQKDLPTTFWVNTLRITPDALIALLASNGLEVVAIPGIANGLRYYGPVQDISLHWTYKAGLLQIQEEVAMLAGNVLQPEAGAKVLDLCAAPGNKMAQLAVSMQGQGLLLANDRAAKRVRAVGQLIGRLGLANVAITLYDGISYPRLANYFDYIMVDAPCSGEGTFRKSTSRLHQHNDHSSKQAARVQLALLKKALHMLKPGGKIVYATCTLSPWENEAVVSDLLRQHQDVELLPLELQHEHSKGLLSWQDINFAADIEKSIRLWPQQNNTGGFYFALLQKAAVVSSVINTTAAEPCEFPSLSAEQQLILDNCLAHFGITNYQQRYKFYASKRGIMLHSFKQNPAANINLDAAGILAVKGKDKYAKLTTYAAMLLGSMATKNVLDVDAAMRDAYMRREKVDLMSEQCEGCKLHAYVLVRYQKFVLGVGWLLEQNGRLLLQSYYPKSLV